MLTEMLGLLGSHAICIQRCQGYLGTMLYAYRDVRVTWEPCYMLTEMLGLLGSHAICIQRC